MTGPDALSVAVAIYREPLRAADWRDQPLPRDTGLLLRIACGEQESLTRARDRALLPETELAEAAVFALQQLLFCNPGDAYRTLGARTDAAHDELRQNYRWLMKWLHPDRHGDGWETVHADRVNRAWQLLKTPDRRSRYDAEHDFGMLSNVDRSDGIAPDGSAHNHSGGSPGLIRRRSWPVPAPARAPPQAKPDAPRHGWTRRLIGLLGAAGLVIIGLVYWSQPPTPTAGRPSWDPDTVQSGAPTLRQTAAVAPIDEAVQAYDAGRSDDPGVSANADRPVSATSGSSSAASINLPDPVLDVAADPALSSSTAAPSLLTFAAAPPPVSPVVPVPVAPPSATGPDPTLVAKEQSGPSVVRPVTTKTMAEMPVANRQEATAANAFLSPAAGLPTAASRPAPVASEPAPEPRAQVPTLAVTVTPAEESKLPPSRSPLVPVPKVASSAAMALVHEFAAAYSAGNARQFNALIMAERRDQVLEQMRQRLSGASMRYLEVGNIEWREDGSRVHAIASVRDTYVIAGERKAVTEVGRMRWEVRLDGGVAKIARVEFDGL